MPAPILLVEDDPNERLLLERAARKADLPNPIVGVGDGDGAVAYLAGMPPYADRQAHPLPVLVLLDLKLPKRSGHEVLAWLRAQEGLRRLPVVVLTASRERADVARAYDLGANSYIQKPVAFEGLLDLLRSVQRYWIGLNHGPDLDLPTQDGVGG